MTENGQPSPDVPTYEPETVAWNLFRQTVGHGYAFDLASRGMEAEALCAAFYAGYRAGRADEAAKR